MPQRQLWQLLMEGKITVDIYNEICMQMAKKVITPANCPNYIEKPSAIQPIR